MSNKDDTRIEPTAVPDPYDDEPEEDLEEDEAPRRRSGRVLPIVVASLAIVGFVVIVYYAYQQGIRAGSEANPPLIRADDSPAKVKPAAPGGMEVPNQNMKVYELGRPGAQSAAAGPERILPKSEEPMKRPSAEPPPPSAAPTLPVAAAPASPPAGSAQPPDAGGAAAQPGVVTPPPPPLPGSGQAMSSPAPSMAEVQTVLTPPAKPSNLAVPPPPPPPPRSGLVPGGRAPAQTASIPQSVPPATASPPTGAQQPARAASPPSRPGPTQQAAAAQAAGGGRVQLGAPNSPEGADKLARETAAKFGDLLGGLKSEVERFDNTKDGKTYYRVIFGTLASKADAVKLCDSLKARKQDCMAR